MNGRNSNGRFGYGNSFGGRKPLTDAQKAFKESMHECLPDAVETLRNILEDPTARSSEKLKAIQIVLDYTLGKPAQSVIVQNNEPDFTELDKIMEDLQNQGKL